MNKATKSCLICKDYFKYLSKIKNRKYCSRSCQHKALSLRELPQKHRENISLGMLNSEKFKLGMRNRIQELNSGSFGIRKYNGKDHWNWLGGKTKAAEILRHSKKYKIWRLAVFARDAFKCIWCKATHNLEADHIKPRSKYPELTFNLNNGRTLCRNCHSKTETYLVGARWM